MTTEESSNMNYNKEEPWKIQQNMKRGFRSTSSEVEWLNNYWSEDTYQDMDNVFRSIYSEHKLQKNNYLESNIYSGDENMRLHQNTNELFPVPIHLQMIPKEHRIEEACGKSYQKETEWRLHHDNCNDLLSIHPQNCLRENDFVESNVIIGDVSSRLCQDADRFLPLEPMHRRWAESYCDRNNSGAVYDTETVWRLHHHLEHLHHDLQSNNNMESNIFNGDATNPSNCFCLVPSRQELQNMNHVGESKNKEKEWMFDQEVNSGFTVGLRQSKLDVIDKIEGTSNKFTDFERPWRLRVNSDECFPTKMKNSERSQKVSIEERDRIYYEEETSWRLNQDSNENLNPAPPRFELPKKNDCPCIDFKYVQDRVVLANFRSDCKELELTSIEEHTLLSIMERDDLVLVIEGILQNTLDWKLSTFGDSLCGGEQIHYDISVFESKDVKSGSDYFDTGQKIAMDRKQFVHYIKHRNQCIANKSDRKIENQNEEYEYTVKETKPNMWRDNGSRRSANLNRIRNIETSESKTRKLKSCIDCALYVNDFDIENRLTQWYKELVDKFCYKDVLPGQRYDFLSSLS